MPWAVLIADDDVEYARALAAALAATPEVATTTIVHDAATAITALTTGGIDAAVLDVRMGGGGALAVARRPGASDIPMIAVTAFASTRVADELRSLGVVGPIGKDAPLGELLAALTTVLAGRQLC